METDGTQHEENFEEASYRFLSDLASGASRQPSLGAYPVPFYDVAREQYFGWVLKANGID